MRKLLLSSAIIGLLLLLLVVMGCGGSQPAEKGPSQPAEKGPSEQDLGAPIYSNATYISGSESLDTVGEGTDKYTDYSASFNTKVSYDKVLFWYKDKLGASGQKRSDTVTSWSIGSPDTKMIFVTVEDKGSAGVEIRISKMIPE